MKHLVAVCALVGILFGGWLLYEGNKTTPKQDDLKTVKTGTTTAKFIQ